MPQIYGNTTGLSPSATKTLERIYRRRVPATHIATPELIKSLVEASIESSRQVGALVHRSGEIDYVIVGDSTKLMLPDIGRLRAASGRLRGLRLVHTHLFAEPITRDDIVDLVRLRLDLVAAIALQQGEARSLSYAYNMPVYTRTGDVPAVLSTVETPSTGAAAHETTSLPYREVGPLPLGRVDVDFAELIAALEDEFAKASRTRPVVAKDGRAILIHVGDKNRQGALAQADESMRELGELSRTAGVEVVDSILQMRDGIDPRHVLGKGKLNDVVLRAAELDAQTLIFDTNLTPGQANTIAKHSDLKIIDRTQLILDIFAQRAETADGKLQVELAQLKYALPRLALKDDALSRLTGGIGGRGPGETKLEIGRRRAKERVQALEDQLKKLSKQREQRRRKRTRQGIPVVSIVGYTNAGKSTLLNTLTGSDVVAENKLFATLDTRTRRIRFPEEREVVITDTVGFIRDLPKDLFAAFRATFEETADADLLLHVVDAADPARDQHIETTEELLVELDLARIPRIVVYNKADLLQPGDARRLTLGKADAITLSARDRETTRTLLAMIADRLQDRWKKAALVPTFDLDDGAASPIDGAGDLAGEEEGTSLSTLEAMLGDRSRKKPTLAARR